MASGMSSSTSRRPPCTPLPAGAAASRDRRGRVAGAERPADAGAARTWRGDQPNGRPVRLGSAAVLRRARRAARARSVHPARAERRDPPGRPAWAAGRAAATWHGADRAPVHGFQPGRRHRASGGGHQRHRSRRPGPGNPAGRGRSCPRSSCPPPWAEAPMWERPSSPSAIRSG